MFKIEEYCSRTSFAMYLFWLSGKILYDQSLCGTQLFVTSKKSNYRNIIIWSKQAHLRICSTSDFYFYLYLILMQSWFNSLKLYWVNWNSITRLFLVIGGTCFVQIGLCIIQLSIQQLILWLMIWGCVNMYLKLLWKLSIQVFSFDQTNEISKSKNIL